MSDNCLFCRIARREIPAHILHEDDRLLAFLDIQPVRPGHTLIIPKQHYPYFEDMPADLAGHILNLGQKLGRHMKRLYGVDRVGFAFTGIHVAHAHAHVIPMRPAGRDVDAVHRAEGPHLHHAAAGRKNWPRPPPSCAANCTASPHAPAEGRRESQRTKQGQVRRPALVAIATAYNLFGGAVFSGFIDFRTVDQLHESHRSVVALTEAHLQHAGVAAVAVRVARTDFGEELHHGVAIAQTGKSQTLVRERGLLPSVIRGSMTRRNSFAFGSVVLIAS